MSIGNNATASTGLIQQTRTFASNGSIYLIANPNPSQHHSAGLYAYRAPSDITAQTLPGLSALHASHLVQQAGYFNPHLPFQQQFQQLQYQQHHHNIINSNNSVNGGTSNGHAYPSANNISTSIASISNSNNNNSSNSNNNNNNNNNSSISSSSSNISNIASISNSHTTKPTAGINNAGNNKNHNQLLAISHVQPQTKQAKIQTSPQTKEQTNNKIRSIKEKCISHYICGQLIIETSKPLTDKKYKTSKKKKSHQHQQQKQQQQPQQQLPQKPDTQVVVTDQHTAQVSQQTPPTQKRQAQPQVQPSSARLPPQPVPPPTPVVNTSTPAKPISHSSGNEIDDIRRIKAEMNNWTVANVVEFIEKHEDIRQYSSKFAEDEVDGKALRLMIDRNLNFQILTSMFKHGPAMKIEAALSKYKLND